MKESQFRHQSSSLLLLLLSVLGESGCQINNQPASHPALWTAFHNGLSDRLIVPLAVMDIAGNTHVHVDAFEAIQLLRVAADGREIIPEKIGMLVEHDTLPTLVSTPTVYLLESHRTMSTARDWVFVSLVSGGLTNAYTVPRNAAEISLEYRIRFVDGTSSPSACVTSRNVLNKPRGQL